MYIYIHTHTHTYLERERGREKDSELTAPGPRMASKALHPTEHHCQAVDVQMEVSLERRYPKMDGLYWKTLLNLLKWMIWGYP